MITINDNDTSIDVAQKLIKGEKRESLDTEESGMTSMFDTEELRKIAAHLLIYCDGYAF